MSDAPTDSHSRMLPMTKAYLQEHVRNSRKESMRPVSKMSKADLLKEYEKFKSPLDVGPPAVKETSMTGRLIRKMKHLEKVSHHESEPMVEHKHKSTTKGEPRKTARKAYEDMPVEHHKAPTSGSAAAPKKAMSPYNAFMSKHRKAGHSMAEIAEMWRSHKK